MAPGARNFAALSLLLAACGAPQSSPSGVEKRSAECAIGAADELRRAGDLDGALALLQQCPESSTAALAAKMDLWIVLGDLDEARRAAMDLAKREPSLRPRAEQVLALPEVDETSGDARSLISASRATRDPAERRALLARARHLFVRLAGAPGRPVLLRNQGALGFAGNTPVWMVGVHELPVEGEPASLIALAAPDLERHVVSLERLFPEGSRVVEWPGHPEAVIVSTPLGGVRVVEPGSERSLNVQGQPLVSPQGDLVLVHGPEDLLILDPSTGVQRAAIRVARSRTGRWLANGSIYAELGSDRVLLIDARKGELLLERDGFPALSASEDRVALLRPGVGDRFQLELFQAGLPDPVRVVSLQLSFTGSPDVRFQGPSTVSVADLRPLDAGDYELVTKATINFETGATRVMSARGGSGPYVAGEATKVQAALVATLGGLVKEPRQLIAANPHTTPHAHSKSGSVVVATTGIPESDCALFSNLCKIEAPSLLFADARRRLLMADVSLPVPGPAEIDLAELLPDERTAFVCGRSEGQGFSFVVDARSGSVWPTPPAGCQQWQLSGSQSSLQVHGGLVLLGPKPTMLELEVARDAPVLEGTTPPPETPGLYCRFGALLAPFALCAP